MIDATDGIDLGNGVILRSLPGGYLDLGHGVKLRTATAQEGPALEFDTHQFRVFDENDNLGAGGILLQNADGSPLSPDFNITGILHVNIATSRVEDQPFPGPSTTYTVGVDAGDGMRAANFALVLGDKIETDTILRSLGIGAQAPASPAGTDVAVTAKTWSPPGLHMQTSFQNSGIYNSTNIPKIDVLPLNTHLEAGPSFALVRAGANGNEDSAGQISFGSPEFGYVTLAVHSQGNGNGALTLFTRQGGVLR